MTDQQAPSFTPGPWAQSHRESITGHFNTQVYDANGQTICTLAWHSVDTGDDGPIVTDRDANARLIAVAPDLLEAARQTEWFIENGRELGFVPIAPSEPALKAVKAAIAKVTGGECIGPRHRDCDSICRVNAKATGAP